jgi:hypothetical protein
MRGPRPRPIDHIRARNRYEIHSFFRSSSHCSACAIGPAGYGDSRNGYYQDRSYNRGDGYNRDRSYYRDRDYNRGEENYRYYSYRREYGN